MPLRLPAHWILLLTLGCSTASQDQQRTVEIPEHLKGLEHLTIHPLDSEPAATMRLVQETSFGDTDEVLFGRMGPAGVDGSGRVFIADWSANTIHVFQPDGSYLTRIGRGGQGPGEFQSINVLLFDPEHLLVYDVGPRRITAFSLETLALSRTVNLLPETGGA